MNNIAQLHSLTHTLFVVKMTDETITIVMCHDGSKYKIQNVKMTSTLNDLKDQITNHKPLIRNWGIPIAPQSQRLFYFGRELKSGSRTLSVLLGSYHRTFPKIMHLHSSQPKVQISNHAADMSNDNNNDDDDDDDDDVLEVIENVNPKKRSTPNAGLPATRANSHASSKGEIKNSNQVVVVDLLNDSDSDDEDVEIIDGPMSKKSRPS